MTSEGTYRSRGRSHSEGITTCGREGKEKCDGGSTNHDEVDAMLSLFTVLDFNEIAECESVGTRVCDDTSLNLVSGFVQEESLHCISSSKVHIFYMSRGSTSC